MTSEHVIPPPPVVSLSVAGQAARFPVGRIFCVGRNYAEHAREMGHDPDRAPPFFFAKPATALVPGGGQIPYPAQTADLHHEAELVVALSGSARDVNPSDATALIYGYAVGIDLTRRDLQAAAKKAGRPWEAAKGFDASAPCSEVVPAAEIGHPRTGAITLEVNGETRQSGTLAEMIWPVPEVLAHLSRLFELNAGDLVFTGTPAGVGALVRGDRAVAKVAGVGEVSIEIV